MSICIRNSGGTNILPKLRGKISKLWTKIQNAAYNIRALQSEDKMTRVEEEVDYITSTLIELHEARLKNVALTLP